MWSVLWRSTHPHSFIYAVWRNHLAVEKLKVDVIWQAAECMTDTSCGISGRTKSLMLRLNRHRPLNDWLSETFRSLKVSQTMMIHKILQARSHLLAVSQKLDIGFSSFYFDSLFLPQKTQTSVFKIIFQWFWTVLECTILQSQTE